MKERHNAFEEGRKKNGMNPQTDGACMIDEQYKAIHFTLGAGLNRLKSAHCIELINHTFNVSNKLLQTSYTVNNRLHKMQQYSTHTFQARGEYMCR